MTGHGHGFGHGLMPLGGGGAAEDPIPPLDNYVIGIDASSYVDPGGGATRRVVDTPITNLAGGSVGIAPHFDPNNLPLLHTGDWTWNNPVRVIPAPAASVPTYADWLSVNKNRDTAYGGGNCTEWEVDITSAGNVTGHTLIIGIYASTIDGALWVSPWVGTPFTARVAMQTTTGRIDCVTPAATRTNLVASGGSTGWARDEWHMWAFGQDTDSFWSCIDGVESTYSTSPVGLGTAWRCYLNAWGSFPDGGVACLHMWDQMHSLATMRPVMAYLAARHGLPYTAP
jgi:hypothetical protein